MSSSSLASSSWHDHRRYHLIVVCHCRLRRCPKDSHVHQVASAPRPPRKKQCRVHRRRAAPLPAIAIGQSGKGSSKEAVGRRRGGEGTGGRDGIAARRMRPRDAADAGNAAALAARWRHSPARSASADDPRRATESVRQPSPSQAAVCVHPAFGTTARRSRAAHLAVAPPATTHPERSSSGSRRRRDSSGHTAVYAVSGIRINSDLIPAGHASPEPFPSVTERTATGTVYISGETSGLRSREEPCVRPVGHYVGLR